MPRIAYDTSIKLAPWKKEIVDKAIGIVTDYQAKGYDLTLRQVYYQFVARDWLPQRWADKVTGSTNNQRSYKNLGDVLNDARMGGYMDWKSMVDRTREMSGNPHWDDPADIINSAATGYQIDKWDGQEYRPEIWVEKDALEGVVGRVARRLDIPYFSCRGYTSLSSIWLNAQRLRDHVVDHNQTPVILHLGDHDPSGVDMSRDIDERVRLFMGDEGDRLIFRRIALNMDQVREFNPPENPAKITDSRAVKYIAEHGESSWELDALDPDTISEIIERNVNEFRDIDLFNDRKNQEKRERDLLLTTSTKWTKVVDFLNNGKAK